MPLPRVRSMPPSVYNRAVSTVRDYPRMVREYDRLSKSLGAKAATSDGMPKSASMGSNVEEKAVRMADLDADIQRIKKNLHLVPDDMRDGILNNVVHGSRFPLNEWGQLVPSLRTWQREKQLFLIRIAHEFKFY